MIPDHGLVSEMLAQATQFHCVGQGHHLETNAQTVRHYLANISFSLLWLARDVCQTVLHRPFHRSLARFTSHDLGISLWNMMVILDLDLLAPHYKE